MLKEIVIIYEGNYSCPEIAAYQAYFASRYAVRTSTYSELRQEHDYSQSALWYVMGFYPRKVEAAFIIHDYRSLSTHKFTWIKDKLKRYANHRPNLRLFHDAQTKEKLAFRDDVPGELLWLGVPEETQKFRATPDRYAYDFCYIGTISPERNSSAMIRSFLQAYGSSKTLLLIGRAEGGLDQQFEAYPNIIFKGKMSQEEVFPLVQQSEFAVCYFPSHRPHCYQIPLKLLEYAALGKKIIANDAPSNLRESQAFKIKATILGDVTSMFPSEQALKDVEDNWDFDATELYWKNRIKASGVEHYLASVP
jgi:glycosyltransferase involved in cell wall biosynthesis